MNDIPLNKSLRVVRIREGDGCTGCYWEMAMKYAFMKKEDADCKDFACTGKERADGQDVIYRIWPI